MTLKGKKIILQFLTFALFILFSSILMFGRTWTALPSMSRAEIQQIFDRAQDGDRIQFIYGVYDFRNEEIVPNYTNTGLFVIEDKSLTIIGRRGNLIIGPDSENGTGSDARGLHAFHILNLNADKDVTFDGLNIQNFLRGIACWYIYPENPDITPPCGRDITVQNCTITDIHRDCVSVGGAQGSVYLINNTLSADRCGLYLSWRDFNDPAAWQPDGEEVVIEDNVVTCDIGFSMQRTFKGKISQNDIDGIRRGIEVYGNKQTLEISSNQLANMQVGIELWGKVNNDYLVECKQCIVKGNNLRNITLIGILINGTLVCENEISENDIHMDAFPDGVGIYTLGHDNQITYNRVSGIGGIAIFLQGAHDEYVYMNTVGEFEPYYVHYFLDGTTHNNRVIGDYEENVYCWDASKFNVVEGIDCNN
jgi:hypothetical protein